MTGRPTGWYPDPADPERSRWWNGSQWTSLTAGPAALAPGVPDPTDPAPDPPPVARPWLGQGWFLLTRALQAALLALIAVDAWAMREELRVVDVVERWQVDPDSPPPVQAMASAGSWAVPTTANQLALAAVVYLLLSWLFLAHRSQDLDRTFMEHESEWRIATRPLRMVQDIHRGLTGRASQSWIGIAALGIWLFSLILRLAAIAFASDRGASAYFPGEDEVGAAAMSAIAAGCEIVAAVLALVLTVQLAGRVRRRMLVIRR